MEIYRIVFIVTLPLYCLSMYFLLTSFLGERITKSPLYFAPYLLFSAYSIYIMEHSLPPILVLFSGCVWLCSLGMLHPQSILKKISVSIIITLILLICEILSFSIGNYLIIDFFSDNSFDSPVILILMRTIGLAMAYCIFKFTRHKENELPFPVYYFFLHLLMFSGLLYLYICSMTPKEPSSIMLLVNSGTLGGIILLSILAESKIQKSLVLHNEKKILEEQNLSFLNQKEIIDQSHAIVSGVRHDMKNHVYSMLLFIDEPTSAKEYAENLLKQLEESENLCHSKNFMIDSIVNFKLQTLDREKISLSVDALAPVELKIPAYDMTVILGNILDNAVTAIAEVTENPCLSLRINTNKSHLIILLKNSYTGNLDIQNGKYQSTKQFKTNHGIGISNVEQAVSRCDGVLKIQHNEEEFMVSISLPIYQIEV